MYKAVIVTTIKVDISISHGSEERPVIRPTVVPTDVRKPENKATH